MRVREMISLLQGLGEYVHEKLSEACPCPCALRCFSDCTAALAHLKTKHTSTMRTLLFCGLNVGWRNRVRVVFGLLQNLYYHEELTEDWLFPCVPCAASATGPQCWHT